MSKMGLVIGKFDPIHLGHINMIKYGARKCDVLNVLVCSTVTGDTIDAQIRFKWVKEIFKDYKNVKVELLEKKMPHFKNSNCEALKAWVKVLKEMYKDVNLIITSELKEEYLAELMTTSNNRVECDIYDFIRVLTPISSTAIRNNPYKNWNYIPSIVKPYYISKIRILDTKLNWKSATNTSCLYYKINFENEAASKIIGMNQLKFDELTTIY